MYLLWGRANFLCGWPHHGAIASHNWQLTHSKLDWQYKKLIDCTSYMPWPTNKTKSTHGVDNKWTTMFGQPRAINKKGYLGQLINLLLLDCHKALLQQNIALISFWASGKVIKSPFSLSDVKKWWRCFSPHTIWHLM